MQQAIKEKEMKIAIACSFQAYSQRNGVSTLATQMHHIFEGQSDLIRIGEFKNKEFLRWTDDPIESMRTLMDYTKVDLACYDFTFVPSIYSQGRKNENLGMLSRFPHPIVARVDDFLDLDEAFTWIKDIDVFVCFKEELGEYCRQKYPTKKVIVSGLPYLPRGTQYKQRLNSSITTMSRLDPIKRLDLLLDVAPYINGTIRLSGTMFNNPDFRYWNRFMLSMASKYDNIVINLSEDFKDVFGELCKSNSYYGATYWKSGIGVEYAALEAMDCGCIPVVTSRMKKDYEREGLKAFFWTFQNELIEAINLSFEHNGSIIEHNYRILNGRPSRFRNELLGAL